MHYIQLQSLITTQLATLSLYSGWIVPSVMPQGLIKSANTCVHLVISIHVQVYMQLASYQSFVYTYIKVKCCNVLETIITMACMLDLLMCCIDLATVLNPISKFCYIGTDQLKDKQYFKREKKINSSYNSYWVSYIIKQLFLSRIIGIYVTHSNIMHTIADVCQCMAS